MRNAFLRTQPISKEQVLQIRHRTSTLRLEDLPLDVGYASEKVSLAAPSGETFVIGGQNGSTQLIVTTPFVTDDLVAQLREIDTLLFLNTLGGVSKSLVVANEGHSDPRLDGWRYGIDKEEAFGDYYGIRIASDELENEFAKALFLISKDGALFYSEIPDNLDKAFDTARAIVKIAAANDCYTGKGCHG